MYPFFETIRYKNGVLENCNYHQNRINRTFNELGVKTNIRLNEIRLKENFDQNIVYKIKFLYNLEGAYQMIQKVYKIKAINTICICKIKDAKYPYKYTNRDWLNDALQNAGTDEIIMVQNKLIKDANYANIVFFDGSQWHTPANPLLLGTHRARLIEEKKINEKVILLTDLSNYKKVKLINAMMTWEESPEIEIGKIEL